MQKKYYSAARHASHVTRHTSQVTRHASHSLPTGSQHAFLHCPLRPGQRQQFDTGSRFTLLATPHASKCYNFAHASKCYNFALASKCYNYAAASHGEQQHRISNTKAATQKQQHKSSNTKAATHISVSSSVASDEKSSTRTCAGEGEG
jgi:hypothetical protein